MSDDKRQKRDAYRRRRAKRRGNVRYGNAVSEKPERRAGWLSRAAGAVRRLVDKVKGE